MMTINDIKEYVACVNGGSGVIFQPADETFTYILTAKHIFYDDNGQSIDTRVNIHYYSKPDNAMVAFPEFDLVTGTNFFPHSENNIDIAILRIARIHTPDKLIITNKYFQENKEYVLGGYPKLRRESRGGIIDLDSFRVDDKIDILDDKEFKRVEADIAKNQNLAELKGLSGGGIFKVSGEYLLLAGIQSRVANNIEALGRIRFTPIEIFNEIIAEYNGVLEVIVPYYLKSFTFLKDSSFSLSGGIMSNQIVGDVSEILRNQTQNVLQSDFTPICIKEHLGSALLLLNNQDSNDVFLKKLWLSWLELLTILNIAKQKNVAKSDFDDLFSEVRFFYSPVDKDFWSAHLGDLAKSDYKGLKRKGLVVVASQKPAGDQHHVLDPSKIVPDISRIRKDYEMAQPLVPDTVNIDDPDNFPLQKFRFVNISAFKDHPIIEGYQQFENMTRLEIINKLKELYEQLIT